jgi:hypothetical protein
LFVLWSVAPKQPCSDVGLQQGNTANFAHHGGFFLFFFSKESGSKREKAENKANTLALNVVFEFIFGNFRWLQDESLSGRVNGPDLIGLSNARVPRILPRWMDLLMSYLS